MSVAAETAYGELLSRYRPAKIKTREENARALTILRKYLSKGEENLTPEERTLVELLAALISDFERSAFKFPRATPAEVLRELMRAHGLRPRDLWDIFGSKGITSEVLRGKRQISKERAKMLAEKFHVSAELFI